MTVTKMQERKEGSQALARPTFGRGLFEELGFPFDRMPWFDRFAKFPFLEEWEQRPFPKMDVFEKKGKLMIHTELPGVEKDQVRVALEDGYLTIEGERKMEKEDETDGTVYRRETAYGRFFRKLPLGFEADPEKVKAKFKNGMLMLEIPMPSEASKPKREVAIT
ncbi:MAG TPA: Hsp20/alpha crystallin family protein [Thermoanaerobaculia bacterium]|nr:Hsp20/alpha crystallin family protein [Thermoanaerobaculia bacterium]